MSWLLLPDWAIFIVFYNILNLLMMEQESIYNIIPKNPQQSPKKPLYKSKFPFAIPPTGSTFCHHTTSRPGVSNLSGEFSPGLQAHRPYGATQTFGHVKGARNSSPTNFQKKRTGTMGNHQLPPSQNLIISVRNFSYDCAHKRQKVPLVSEKPVFGQRSNKNFIVSNAIQNILSSAKKSPRQVDWLKKKDFGKTPQYISFIKDSLSSQYNLIRTLQQQKEQKKQEIIQNRKVLSQEQIDQIREGLKRKWNQVNKEYQNMTHIRLIDTQGLKRRKQGYEKQLQQIEQDMKKLNKAYIFVEQ